MAEPRICLNMIVRNEAPIIERCLTSVLPAIDYYVICDTGSTDDTVARIRELMDGRGVAGEIHDTEFHDFGSARNEALDRCRGSRAEFDYILLTDADMELRIADAGFRGLLDAPAYSVRQYNWLSYYNTRLIRRDHDARYVGMTHEYLAAGWPLPRLEALTFFDHACGSSHAVKFERDLRLLKIELERDPGDVRAMFYLAQTYRDMGNHRLAIEWYLRRAEAGGWDEEVWYAVYSAARSYRDLGEDDAFVRLALRAYGMRPSRAEPLYELARYYREQGRYDEALTVAELGAAIPLPVDETMFVHTGVYSHAFALETSIAGYSSAHPARRAAARAACASLATDREAAPSVRTIARRNWMYYAKSAAELFGSCEIREIGFHPEEPWVSTNPSIMSDGGALEMIVRTVNYRIEQGWYVVPDGFVRTRNHHAVLDDSLAVVRTQPLIEGGDAPRLAGATVQGLEDCRLFMWRGRRFCSFTIKDRNPEERCEMGVGEIAGDGTVSVHPLRGYRDDRHQKNWMPLVRGDELLFIYSTDPTIILRCDERFALHEIVRREPSLALKHLRGGSQAVRVDGGWIYVAHEVSVTDSGRVYLHRFVRIDDDFVVQGVSEAFWFFDRQIEFAAGLAIDGDRLLVSFGTMDRQAWIARFDTAAVLAALAGAGAAG
jgi:glycosyltransferase involved in cell wall biosynthesis